jgi:excinuclease ABC subunit B
MASVIQNVQKPTLVISHNKTLAAQLYSEFKNFFPENAVEYFVSYYDYYQPEAYLPPTDTYIDKDTSINEEIEKLRLSATTALISRKDVIVVASVSCIYGLGAPESIRQRSLFLEKGQQIRIDQVMNRLVQLQYERNNLEFKHGIVRVKGDVIDIFTAYGDNVFRIELLGDKIERISIIDPLNFKFMKELHNVVIYPAKHFIISKEEINSVTWQIKQELGERITFFKSQNRIVEAHRLEQRVKYDLEMMQETGYCKGIENYSRYFTGRPKGEPPYTLIDYFPNDFLMLIDESHVTLPQLGGMYEGDKSRKNNLIEYGFRLPSAYDNRPLIFDEFQARINQVVYISATPAKFELDLSVGNIVEQIVRPTGLLDPEITVKPVKGQVDDLISEMNKVIGRSERILVTTLTKRMAEDLTDYLVDFGVRARYLHSEIDTLERVEYGQGTYTQKLIL